MADVIDPNSAEVGRIFATIQTSWFRLATLQHYDIPGERESVAEFVRTGRPAPAPDRFVRLIQRHTAAGRTLRRVLVAEEPLSDYLRFSLSAAAPCVAAGEDVRILSIQDGAGPQQVWEGGDFWLLDDTQLWTMHHDAHGRLTGVTHIDEAEALESARRTRDLALAESITLAQYSNGRV